MKVSVIIPAFNMESWLGRALDSVFSQDVPAEVIVVDDGSTDATAEIAASYPTVTLVRQENQGVSASRNRGVQASEGEAILFLDADDELMHGSLSKLIAALEVGPECSAATANFIRVGADAEVVAWRTSAKEYLARRDVRRVVVYSPLAVNSLFRRSVLGNEPFDPRLSACEDQYLWIGLLLAGHRVVALPEPLVKVHDRPSRATASDLRMRYNRRLFFEILLERHDLSATERATVMYMLVRAAAGEVLAARRENQPVGPPSSNRVGRIVQGALRPLSPRGPETPEPRP